MCYVIGLAAAGLVLMAVSAGAAQPKPKPGAVLVPAPPAPAARLAAIPQAEQATEETALAYAQAFMPVDLIGEAAEPLFRQTFREGFAAEPANRALERQYPGLREATETAGVEAMRRVFARELPAIHRRLATLVRPRVREADLRAVNAFMATDTAIALQRTAARNIDPEAAARPQTAEDVQALALRSVGGLNDGQIAELTRFAVTPAGQAMQALSPAATAFVARETNGLTAVAAPEVQAAVVAAIRQRMEGKAK